MRASRLKLPLTLNTPVCVCVPQINMNYSRKNTSEKELKKSKLIHNFYLFIFFNPPLTGVQLLKTGCSVIKMVQIQLSGTFTEGKRARGDDVPATFHVENVKIKRWLRVFARGTLQSSSLCTNLGFINLLHVACIAFLFIFYFLQSFYFFLH